MVAVIKPKIIMAIIFLSKYTPAYLMGCLHIAKKAIARCIPIVGAGAYAYYDTARVGKTAIELFSSNIE
jgi:hypothetical protein